MSERTFRRWSVRFEEEGEAGLFDRRVGERSGKPVPADRGGIMLHQDGSRHAWREGLPALDLIVAMDDATSALFPAFLAEEEGTATSFLGLSETFAEHGLLL